MKKVKASLGALALVAAGLFAFVQADNGSITGTVSPANGAKEVMAITGADTVKAAVANGAFNLNVQPGTYQVVVEAEAPYKNFVQEKVEVRDGEATDLGTITLEE